MGTEWEGKQPSAVPGALQTLLKWLQTLDFVESVSRQRYRLTRVGHELANELRGTAKPSVPWLAGKGEAFLSAPANAKSDAWDDATSASSVECPSVGPAKMEKEAPATNPTDTHVPPQPMQTTDPLLQEATLIADQIEEMAVKGGDGSEFEKLAARAFSFLGFDADVKGGPGNPDVVLTALLGEGTYRGLIDTKSRSSGCVQQNDVNFQALREHKSRFKADYMVVLGADFSQGNLEKWARDEPVRLLRTRELRQVMIAYTKGVIALDRLKPLFEGGGLTDPAVISAVLADSDRTAHAMLLARLVYDAVRSRQGKKGVLNANTLYYILNEASPQEISFQCIQATAELLQSDLIGALAKTPEGSLYTRLSPHSLADKLTQLRETLGGRHRNS